jgi:hypothetical protein
MALKQSECMTLSLQDLHRMKQEFLEMYEKFFMDSYNRLRRALTLKLKAMKLCAEMESTSNNNAWVSDYSGDSSDQHRDD